MFRRDDHGDASPKGGQASYGIAQKKMGMHDIGVKAPHKLSAMEKRARPQPFQTKANARNQVKGPPRNAGLFQSGGPLPLPAHQYRTHPMPSGL
jgi:hypothetical protein